jgi:hypothetical protein
VTSPPSRLTCWIVDDPVAAAPVAVVFDAADVSIVPDDKTPAFTAAAVFVRVTPVADVQPRVDSADRPDRTSVPTVTDVPYPVAWKPSSPVPALAAAGAAAPAQAAGSGATTPAVTIIPATKSPRI